MTDGADSGGRYDSNKRLHSTEIMGTETEKAPHAKKSRLEEANIKQKEQIPNEIPDEKNVHIDNIKKRRSSLRRSINGGFTSTLRGIWFVSNFVGSYLTSFFSRLFNN